MKYVRTLDGQVLVIERGPGGVPTKQVTEQWQPVSDADAAAWAAIGAQLDVKVIVALTEGGDPTDPGDPDDDGGTLATRGWLRANVDDVVADAVADIGAAAVQARDQAVQAAAAIAARDVRNIVDPAYGVVRGTESSQTAAIKAALGASPGEPFYFPPGAYRLDTQLDIPTNNPIILAPGARLYAGAPMDVLVNYDNGEASANNFTQDAGIFGGGTLDGALLANRALRVSSTLRFPIKDLTIVDALHRGLVTTALNAEILASNIRVINRGTTNSHRVVSVTTTSGQTGITGTGFTAGETGSPILGAGIPAGATLTVVNSTTATLSTPATASATVNATLLTNIAIEVNGPDNHFRDIWMRDCTVGVWDKGGNRWRDVHPWLGTASQLAVRYPVGVGWLFGSTGGVSTLIGCEADTYRYAFRTAAASGYANAAIHNPKVSSASSNLSTALAAANPGAVYDLADGGRLEVSGSEDLFGPPTTPHAYTAGSAARLSTPGNSFNRGGVSGVARYLRGVQLGAADFNPTVFGSTSGGLAAATTLTGKMAVSEDSMVRWVIRCVGTVAASGVSGNLRIGNLPYPTGATDVKIGVVSVSTSVGVDMNGGECGGVTAGQTNVIRPTKSLNGVTTQVNLGSLMGQAVEFTLVAEAAFSFPFAG